MSNNSDIFANLKFRLSDEPIKATLVFNDEEIPVSGKKGKWFTNIPVNHGDLLFLKDNPSDVQLVFSKGKIYHPDQVSFDEKNSIEEYFFEGSSIYYSLNGERTSPKKVLITFPGVSNFDNVNYRLSAMTSIQSRLKGVLIIAFQDKESVYGNYMFKTNEGLHIKPAVVDFIRLKGRQYGLPPSDFIFYGNSKGGSIAVDYIDEFPDSAFFIDIPQLDLFNYDAQNALMRFSLGAEVRNYYNFLEYLPSVKHSKVTYSFAENDFDASRGLPLKKFTGINTVMLKDMGHSGAAMELVKRQFSKVIQLITGDGPILRYPIDVRFAFTRNKLYSTRILGSFKEESEAGRVYAEIEFHDDISSYSVSLNKRFEKVLISFWKNGFDVLKHLPEGVFSVKFHVYFDYREFVYPVNSRLIIRDGNVQII